MSALARLDEGLALVRGRQQRAHLAEAAVLAGALALWASSLVDDAASLWFAIGLGICWFFWRDATVLQRHGVGRKEMARWLDRAVPQLEDSVTLVLHAQARGLTALQRDRIASRLQALDEAELAGAIPAPRHRVLPWFAGLGALGAVFLALPSAGPPPSTTAVVAPAPTLARVSLEVTPPAYTHLEPFTDDAREVIAPQGSMLTWEVRTEGDLAGVQLLFDDGERSPLTRAESGRWRSAPRVAAASAYRVVADVPWAHDDRFRLLRIIPDRPPQFDFTAPTRTVTELDGIDPQPMIDLDVEVADDYGIREVVARLTLASGGGENVRFRERSVPLEALAGGTDTARRYRHRFDLRSLAMEPGDELYVHLEARDNREPEANLASSRTWIVRWPAERYAEQDEVGVMAMRVMPEYFRSQRQIIIDTEALVAAAPQLSVETFAGRAQAIAFDQKALRLRYGTFLGEESVTDIGPGAMPDQDDPPLHYPGDGHDHGEGAGGFGAVDAPTFGRLDTVLQQFGHTHDTAEQATLFDPQTRDLLKAALAEMWGAELQLRLATPDAALPFEYDALDLIKRVQQRSRIYLRRVGFRTTPPDEGRRFSGELDDLTLSTDSRFPAAPQEQALARRALASLADLIAGEVSAIPNEFLDAVGQVLQDQDEGRSELLSAIGALESLRTAPGCRDCAAQLAQGLLRLVPAPLPPAQAREAPRDALARAYARGRAGARR
ncbi:MAG: hypothetical protein AAF184_25445 [Pseudomonadota bacterium]